MRENRQRQVPVLYRVALLAWVVAVSTQSAVGQQPSPTPKSPTAKATKPAASKKAAAPEKPFRGRLPMYYGKVVDQRQRETIYEIQKEYAPRIDELATQLAALLDEQQEKVAAVLSPEQVEKVVRFKAEAKAKRDKAKAERDKAKAASGNKGK